MKHPLRGYTTLAFIATALVGLLGVYLFSNIVRNQYRAAMVSALRYEAQRLAVIDYSDADLNEDELQLSIGVLNAELWVANTHGTVVYHAGYSPYPQEIQGFSPNDFASGYMSGDFYGWFKEPTLTVVEPLNSLERQEGYVLLHYPESLVDNNTNRVILFVFIAYLIALMALLGLYFFIMFMIFTPLSNLRKASREYANGNLSYPLEIRQTNEFSAIWDDEKAMASQIGKASDAQRKFLANVSHDFRSPLTSIHGYVAAIQDGTIPPERQEKYLNVVLSETERLTNLANDLLDLNQLEKGLVLNRSDFDINDLIRGLLPTFEGRVTSKHQFFDLYFESPSLFVNGDRERIEQVLHNLVDNAIKFSGKDSVIRLATHSEGNKIFVSVRDSGVGIQKGDLAKIWNRFYKSDSSRGKDKTGTGLGLSIVREIIQAHDEYIDVISTPGKGTEFIFTLSPAVK